jgi:dTDP-4-amino-4,6-dideoxygalactose transaminase
VAARRPVYRPAHHVLGVGGFPAADRLWARTLSLPCYPTLADGEIDTVAAALREALA